jgi:aminoglycoside phosphotransferase (APT) family kinase protein
MEAIRAIARQVLPGPGPGVLERMQGGVSTPVYRIARGGVTLYLRLAEEREASLAPEVLAHRWLRERGVRVPEIVYYDMFNEPLQRAVMVTTEIPGRSLAADYQGIDVGRVLVAAGRDLAVINAHPVSGFGFVRRDRRQASCLEAEFPTWREFALGEMDRHLAALSAFLDDEAIAAIGDALDQHVPLLETPQAVLAHGDFDLTHIYHVHGDYSGVIDFGEMRGADPFYDLGHFALHDGEFLPDSMLSHLLAGYRQAAPLPLDHERRIQLWSVLIGVRALARSVNRPRSAYQEHLATAVRRAVTALA